MARHLNASMTPSSLECHPENSCHPIRHYNSYPYFSANSFGDLKYLKIENLFYEFTCSRLLSPINDIECSNIVLDFTYVLFWHSTRTPNSS